MSEEWLEKDLEKVFEELREVMLDRQKKYGPGNISRHGVAGVMVRLDDKFSRLSFSDADHYDESVRDTWIDIANYAIIALLFLEGKWPGSEKEE